MLGQPVPTKIKNMTGKFRGWEKLKGDSGWLPNSQRHTDAHPTSHKGAKGDREPPSHPRHATVPRGVEQPELVLEVQHGLKEELGAEGARLEVAEGGDPEGPRVEEVGRRGPSGGGGRAGGRGVGEEGALEPLSRRCVPNPPPYEKNPRER